MATLTRTVKIVSVSCGNCGILFGLDATFRDARLDDGKSFYCPNGHFVGWKATNEAEKREKALTDERDAARELAQREARRRSRAEAEARTADYRARAAKGQLTKARKRMAAGVCPCCNRTFSNVVRHMAGQHPEFLAEVQE